LRTSTFPILDNHGLSNQIAADPSLLMADVSCFVFLQKRQILSSSDTISTTVLARTIEGNSSRQTAEALTLFQAPASTTVAVATTVRATTSRATTSLTQISASIIIHPPNHYGTCVELLNKRGLENHPSLNARKFLPARTSTDNRLLNWSRVKLYYKYIEVKVTKFGLSEEDAAKEIDAERVERGMNMSAFCTVLRKIPGIGCDRRGPKRRKIQ